MSSDTNIWTQPLGRGPVIDNPPTGTTEGIRDVPHLEERVASLTLITQAMWTLIKRRNDIDPSEPVKLPGYPKWNRPSCAGIAAIAFKGGVWEFEGPDPVPLGVSAAEAAALEPPPAPIRPWTPPFLCFAAAFLVAAITALIVDQCRRFGWRRRGRVVEEAFVSAIQVFAATFAVASSAFLLLSQLWFLA